MATVTAATAISAVMTINAVDSDATVNTKLAKITPVAFAVRSRAKISGRRCGGASVSRVSE